MTHRTDPWPLDPARDAAIVRSNAAVVQRCDAAVSFVLRLLGGLALVALAVWALLTFMEPCAAGQLCGVVPLVPLRRLRAGTPPPPEPPLGPPLGPQQPDPAAHRVAPSAHCATRRADAALRAMHAAGYADGERDGEREGYVHGVRAGRLAGFVWGVLCGALVVALAFHAGYRGGM